MDALGQLGTGESLSDGIVANVCDLAQAVEQAERLEHTCVDADADAGVASLDPLQRRSGCKGTLGYHCHREATASAGVVDVRPQLA